MKHVFGPGQVEVRRLTAHSPERVFAAIDRVLLRARPLLVRAGEALIPARARAEEAEDDPQRILVFAVRDRKVAGFSEAALHTPEPLDLTIAQLAVGRRARHTQVGRALVLATLLIAEEETKLGALVAAIHPNNHGARAFWERLGLAATGEESAASIILRADAAAIREELLRRLSEG